MAKPMTLEEVLDEENREVLAALLKSPPPQRTRGSSSSSGSGGRASPLASPRSPTKSMPNVDGATRSSVPPNSGVKRPLTQNIRSLLDINRSSSPGRSSHSAQTSPTEVFQKAHIGNKTIQHRSLSDASTRPPMVPGRAIEEGGYGVSEGCRFSGGPVAPKRNTFAGKKGFTSAMASFVSGPGISNSPASKSPNNVLGLRPNAPIPDALDFDKLLLDDGKAIDKNKAYLRLSDANPARSGGILSTLPGMSRRRRTNSGDAIDQVDGTRLEKDYEPTGEEDALEDSSEDDEQSSDEDQQRGRQETGSQGDILGGADLESKTIDMGRAKGPGQASNLMASAEEERQQIAAQQSKYKARPPEPEITVTSPSGDRLKSSRPSIHPHTSFDQGPGTQTPADSDGEADITDIRRAQKLAVNMTPVVSTPATNRCVRTIYRGDFPRMQKEAIEELRRVRKYLVATDLSDEASHALEWTIGTVLRDGDTFLAIYCIDEEAPIGKSEDEANGDEPQRFDSALAKTRYEESMKAQAAAIAAFAKTPISTTPVLGATAGPTPLGPAIRLGSERVAASPMGREPSKAEMERYKVVEAITKKIAYFLRKTKLQVRAVIEVIHCKSPKHLITEVIDFINPTMVVLGSRGRSALKGVILGSFSNYLVTKSSVPVMVARKRLKKHSRSPNIQMANNISKPSAMKLAHAKID